MIKKSITTTGKKEPERAVPMLVQTASSFRSSIMLSMGEKTVNAKSIMGMLAFGVTSGAVIEVTVDGEDEQEAMDRIEAFLTEE